MELLYIILFGILVNFIVLVLLTLLITLEAIVGLSTNAVKYYKYIYALENMNKERKETKKALLLAGKSTVTQTQFIWMFPFSYVLVLLWVIVNYWRKNIISQMLEFGTYELNILNERLNGL